MNNPKFQHLLAQHEMALRRYVESSAFPAKRLQQAMTYSLFSGGKRLRPLLIYLCGELVNAPMESLDVIAAAVEIIHCYSLIHDDLPAMDNDDFRRGQPTCHRAFDEATAILVGDGMQALANEILLTHLPPILKEGQVIRIAHELNKASGFQGMVSGQSLDLSELNQPHITETVLENIHRLKTGALFSACINMALLAGNADAKTTQLLQQYANHLGLAFQMQDDYQDRYEAQHETGKKRASDEANCKLTFAQLFTQRDLLAKINTYYQQMQELLGQIIPATTDLLELTLFLQQRTY